MDKTLAPDHEIAKKIADEYGFDEVIVLIKKKKSNSWFNDIINTINFFSYDKGYNLFGYSRD